MQDSIIIIDLLYFADFQVCPLCQGESGNLCYSVGRNISCECPFSEDTCLLLQKSCEDLCADGLCDGDTCNCSPGFTGAHCDEQLCGNQICNNGSVCNIVDGTHTCQCPTKFMGEFCDQGKLPC